MPVHDWTLVEDGIFHALHVAWLPLIQKSLNAGVLPEGYYALAEQHAGRAIADVITLHEAPELSPKFSPLPRPGGIAVAEAPPRVRRKQTLNGSVLTLQRSLAIRHVSGHELIALIEVLSPANKDRAKHIDEFAAKVESALDAGIHVLIIDLFPPGPHDLQGIHGAIHQMLEPSTEKYDLPADEPLTLASYVAGARIDVYLEHLGVGSSLPEMPLFLNSKHYVNVPLESTYQSAYEGMPAFWRAVLEGKKPTAV